jgi:hypothetical protein
MAHSLLLFLHVASAMSIVAAFGIEMLQLMQLRASRTLADAQAALGGWRYVQRTGGIGLLVTVLTGVSLATIYWGWRGAWMGVAFLTVVAIAIVGATLTGRPIARFQREAAVSPGTSSASALHPRLSLSYMIRTALFVGIIYLMTTKPANGAVALLVIAIAAVAGVGTWLVTSRRRQIAVA